jgi:hypothetical protein
MLDKKMGESGVGVGLSARAMNNITALKMRSDAMKAEVAKKGEREFGSDDYPNTTALTTTRNVTISLTGNPNKLMHGVAGDAEVTAANMAFSFVDNLMKPVGATATIVEGVGAVMKSVASIKYLFAFCMCFAWCLVFMYGFQHGEIAPFAGAFFKWLAHHLTY